jgi:hypothetical protein
MRVPEQMAMTSDQMAEERRRGRYAGAAAIAAGLLFPAGVFWSQSITRDGPTDNTPAELRFFDRHSTPLVVSSALRALALLLVAVVAMHLYRATKARKPDLNQAILFLGVVAPATLAIGTFAHTVFLAVVSADFTGREFQTIQAAKDLSSSWVRVVTIGLSVAGTAGIAIWFLIGSLNAMRVGLLTRFMGVLGVIIGPAFLFGLAPLLMTFWLLALGALFVGHWPRAIPPAWAVGEAVPWPSRGRTAEDETDKLPEDAPNGEVQAVGPGVRDSEPSDQGTASEPAARARKRKRRR